jgi:7-cyano-7-deazaguanine reductase
MPDFGRVVLEYVPQQKCLELKSFKLYLGAFRDLKVFHEGVTEVILADMVEAVEPLYASLTVEMNPRGNVKTVCRKSFGRRQEP